MDNRRTRETHEERSNTRRKSAIRSRTRSLLEKALAHSSYAYENAGGHVGDNEILEFLGDSVVGLAVADFIFARYPDLDEGDLSKLKSTSASTLSLADFARNRSNWTRPSRLGKGEEKSGGREKKTILAGAFEAVVGAIYLDGGFEAARDFYSRLLTASFKADPRGICGSTTTSRPSRSCSRNRAPLAFVPYPRGKRPGPQQGLRRRRPAGRGIAGQGRGPFPEKRRTARRPESPEKRSREEDEGAHPGILHRPETGMSRSRSGE